MPSDVGTLAAHPSPGAAPAPTLRDLSDEALLDRFAIADPEATPIFIERFQRRVFGLAFSIVRDPRGAEDVAQEALLRAWRHAAVFDRRRGSVAAWLLTITRNLAIDATRSRRPVAIDPDDLPGLSLASSKRDPSEEVAVRDDVGRLREALARLPDEQRRAVILAGAWGLSAREIGEREAIPIGTAKTRIRAAFGRLRRALAEEEATG